MLFSFQRFRLLPLSAQGECSCGQSASSRICLVAFAFKAISASFGFFAPMQITTMNVVRPNIDSEQRPAAFFYKALLLLSRQIFDVRHQASPVDAAAIFRYVFANYCSRRSLASRRHYYDYLHCRVHHHEATCRNTER